MIWQPIKLLLKRNIERAKKMKKNQSAKPKSLITASNFDPYLEKELEAEAFNKKILIDTNLVLDFLLNRQSIFLEDTTNILNLVLSKKVKGYITQKGLEDIWHISEKLKGSKSANCLIDGLSKSLTVCEVDSKIIYEACEFNLHNFDSRIQLACLRRDGLDAIVTLNPETFLGEFEQGYESNQVNVLKPSDFLIWYKSGGQRTSTEDFDNVRERLNKELKIVDDMSIDKKLAIAGWSIEHFDVLCSQNRYAKATIRLWKLGDGFRTEFAYGKGPIDALCRALNQGAVSFILPHPYIIHSIKSKSLEEGIDSRVFAVVVLRCGGKFHRGENTHVDSIKATFYAYAQALNNLFSGISISSKQSTEVEQYPPRSERACYEIITQYTSGRRDFSGSNLSNENLLEVNWQDINLSNSNLSGAIVSQSCLRRADLSRANLKGAVLNRTDLSECKLEWTDLSEATLEEAILRDTNLFHADMRSVNMQIANLQGAKLNKANLSKADLSSANLSRANLDNANLSGINLSMATLRQTILHEVDLSGAILNKAILSEANLIEANLTGADLRDARLCRANLSKADLSGADLAEAILVGANLSDVNLTGANLTGADLSGANLAGANLTRAKLSEANLTGANLTKVDFSETNLDEAIFSRANLQELKLSTTLLYQELKLGATPLDQAILDDAIIVEWISTEPKTLSSSGTVRVLHKMILGYLFISAC